MPRYEKIAEEIRKEASLIIHDELNDPRLGFVTVTRVEMAKDLRFGKIFYSVLGSDADYKRTKKALDSALGFIRKLISERVNLKFAPEIAFCEDRSSEYGVRIEEVLNQIKELESKTQKELPDVPKKGRRLRKKK
ncbi:MAG: 30S ribosome-binding factor RbfA [Candidatus Omnitrophota bacterium]